MESKNVNEPGAEARAALESAIHQVRTGHLNAGVRDAERAIELAPDWLDPRGHLAGVFTLRGKYVEALAQYDRVLALDPGNPPASLLAASLCVSLVEYDRALAYNRNARVGDCHDPGAFEQQRRSIEERLLSIRRCPRLPVMRMVLSTTAAICWTLGQRRLALRILELAVATQTHTARLLLQLGRLRFEQPTYDLKEKHQNAAALVRQSLILEPNSEDAYSLLARIFLRQGDMEQALAEARQALAISTAALDAHHVMAEAYVHQNKYGRALEVYDRLGHLPPHDVFVHLNQGILHQNQKNYQAAKDCYDKARWIDLENPLTAFLETTRKLESRLDGDRRRSLKYSEFDPEIRLRYGDSWAAKRFSLRRVRDVAKRTMRFFTGTVRQFRSKRDFRVVPCAVCGSRNYRHVCFCTGNGWRIVRCTDCGLVYTNPQPAPRVSHRIYQNKYWEGSRVLGAEEFHRDAHNADNLQEIDIPLFRWLNQNDFENWSQRLGRERRAIDVGCGSGIFMRELINRGWNVAGVEVAEDVVGFCQHIGLDVQRGTLQQANQPENGFDLAAMHHVIEHVTDPAVNLQEIRRILRPGGRLIVRTPCCDSVPSLLAGRDWFYSPDHIYFFSRNSLTALLERNGFRVLDTMSTVGVKYETWPHAWYEARLNDAIRRQVETYNQGDVIVVYAEVT